MLTTSNKPEIQGSIPLEEARRRLGICSGTLKNYLTSGRLSGIKEKGKWAQVCTINGELPFYKHHRVVDSEGKRFGKLLVLEVFGRNKNRKTLWRCRCDCGKECIAAGTSLRLGKKRSCGCTSLRKKTIEQLALYDLLTSYKRTANKKGLSFELDPKDFWGLILDNCHYCQDPPKTLYKRKFSSKDAVLEAQDFLYYNGIDRVDNKLGYSKDNCVACCCLCNQAKMNLSEEEFKALVTRIYKNYVEGKS